jgi:predicted CXXCH cytochrome family protein
MDRLKIIKVILACLWALGGSLLVGASAFRWPAAAARDDGQQQRAQQPAAPRPGGGTAQQQTASADYVGTDTCAACHDAQHQNFRKTVHAELETDASWKGKTVGCESCHGPGSKHVELMSEAAAGGAPPASGHMSIRSLKEANETAKDISDTCLRCHAGKEDHNNFRRSEHWRNGVGCTSCHTAHDPDPAPNEPRSHTLIAETPRRGLESTRAMLRENPTALCLRCHSEQRAQFTMPFRHKVLEGHMRCSDCHNPHGGFESKQLRLSTGTDAVCAKCHTDKQGPFVFEHSPVKVEGCTICHTPHGSNNAKLLTRSHVFQLCIECHSNAHQLVLREDGEGAPAPPGFHNLTQERIRNCTTCHTQIHGSNNHNFFFR